MRLLVGEADLFYVRAVENEQEIAESLRRFPEGQTVNLQKSNLRILSPLQCSIRPVLDPLEREHAITLAGLPFLRQFPLINVSSLRITTFRKVRVLKRERLVYFSGTHVYSETARTVIGFTGYHPRPVDNVTGVVGALLIITGIWSPSAERVWEWLSLSLPLR